MSFDMAMNMGRYYVMVGVMPVLILMAIGTGVKALVCRLTHKEFKVPDKTRSLWWFVFLSYFFVVMEVTVIDRGYYSDNKAILPLFYSYKNAWNGWVCLSGAILF